MKKISSRIGIRIENKDVTERRAPLTPALVKQLIETHDLQIVVQPSATRVFSDEDYRAAGAEISENLADCNIVMGVKEIPKDSLESGASYCFFSHTIKGQSYNMPMLKVILDRGINLIDYELIANNKGRRTVFFGNYAGYAGIINSLWAMGERLHQAGIKTPLYQLRQAKEYAGLNEARKAVAEVGEMIRRDGLPAETVPLVCGFTGYGQVSKGAQSIYDLLPTEEIDPDNLEAFYEKGDFRNDVLYKVEFHEIHMFEPRQEGATFDLQEYFNHPQRYKGKFEQYVPYLSMMINGIYWEPQCPQLLTKAFLKQHFEETESPRLKVIGDITCDIEGSVEMTVKASTSDNPVFIYNPADGSAVDGFNGPGVAMMTIDKLPAELPREASQFFGEALMPYLPKLAAADFQGPLADLKIHPDVKKAIIAYRGELTAGFKYLEEKLKIMKNEE